MSFTLVISREGGSDAVTAVPSGWVQNSCLYWPRSKRKADIEKLRSNPSSAPEENWTKTKCRVKLTSIQNFTEALRLEELYSKFDDTEDEERFISDKKVAREHPTLKAMQGQLLDVNALFQTEDTSADTGIIIENNTPNTYIQVQDMSGQANTETDDENHVIEEDTSIIKIAENNMSNITDIDDGKYAIEQDTAIIKIAENNMASTTEKDDGNYAIEEDTTIIKIADVTKLIDENNTLVVENARLKKEIQRLSDFQTEVNNRFVTIQVQLDKIIELLKTKNFTNVLEEENDTEESSLLLESMNIKFPINTQEKLDLLEIKLVEKTFEKKMVSKFSRMCGTSGISKASKIILPLFRYLFTDELLYKCTWKGIKGCNKIPFVNYIHVREFVYKVLYLADKSCSMHDSDLLIQNSSIKHSGQRIKRKLMCDAKTAEGKKAKNCTSSTTGSTCQNRIAKKLEGEQLAINTNINGKNTIQIKVMENQIDTCATNTSLAHSHHSSRKFSPAPSTSGVTVLSDVLISNKICDIKNPTKAQNISFIE